MENPLVNWPAGAEPSKFRIKRADYLADLPGFTRSVYAQDHALIAPESRVWQPFPGWYGFCYLWWKAKHSISISASQCLRRKVQCATGFYIPPKNMLLIQALKSELVVGKMLSQPIWSHLLTEQHLLCIWQMRKLTALYFLHMLA